MHGEIFSVILTGPTNATLAIDKATCTIVDSSQNAPSQPIYLPLARR